MKFIGILIFIYFYVCKLNNIWHICQLIIGVFDIVVRKIWEAPKKSWSIKKKEKWSEEI